MAEELEQEVQETTSEAKTPFHLDQFMENNKQKLMIGGGVFAVLIVALIFVFFKWLPERNAKAQDAIFMAQMMFNKDSFAVALNGDASRNITGFAQVAKDYSWTATGDLANYYSGICNYQLKKYDEAINYLKKFSTSDPIVGAVALNATGDAYAELGKMDDALNCYEKAAKFSDNEIYTPMYLRKLGMALEKQKKYADAVKYYEQVRDNYPRSDEGRDIEKYIERAKAASL